MFQAINNHKYVSKELKFDSSDHYKDSIIISILPTCKIATFFCFCFWTKQKQVKSCLSRPCITLRCTNLPMGHSSSTAGAGAARTRHRSCGRSLSTSRCSSRRRPDTPPCTPRTHRRRSGRHSLLLLPRRLRPPPPSPPQSEPQLKASIHATMAVGRQYISYKC